jgi:hypothetical protein
LSIEGLTIGGLMIGLAVADWIGDCRLPNRAINRHSSMDNRLINRQSVDRQSPIGNPSVVNLQSATANG